MSQKRSQNKARKSFVFSHFFHTERMESRVVPSTFTVTNINDSGVGSLRDAIVKANSNTGNDTIGFDSSLNNKTIVLSSELLVNDPSNGTLQITVDANTSVSLSGGKSTFHFRIISDANIKGLKMIDGNSDYGIGSILLGGALTLESVIFSGIYGTIVSCNSANKPVNIKGCTFTGNIEGKYGRNEIYISQNSSSVLSISDSNFKNNRGCAVYTESDTAKVLIANSTFSDFTLGYYGVIAIYGNSPIISNCVFENNSIRAITFWSPSTFTTFNNATVVNCRFINNTDNGNAGGGGIFISGGPSNVNLTILNSYFDNNTASNGGAVYNEGQLNIVGSVFKKNVADTGGAIITTYSSTLKISGSSFVENIASKGGAIYTTMYDNRKMSVDSSTFSNNTASWGGAIYSRTNVGSDIKINSCTFAKNTAVISGGGIYCSDLINLYINNSIIALNSAPTNPDVHGLITSSSYSIYSSSPQLYITNKSIVNQNPLLGNLMSYGANRFIMPLLPTSPAIGSGDPIIKGTIDQVDNKYDTPDMGAVSYHAQSLNMVILDGDKQATTVGGIFSSPLQVIIKDLNGNTIPGTSVTFAIASTGASASFLSSNTVTTNLNGVATSPILIANSIAGTFTVKASASGASNVTFDLLNTASTASAIVLTNGNNQSTAVNSVFAQALQAKVVDRYGNPVMGVPVAFGTPTSGPSGKFSSSNIVNTTASGLATAPTFTANTVSGVFQVSVSSTGLTTQTFNLNNNPGGASSIIIQDGNNQSATVGAAFSKSLQLIVKDSYGNPVPGISITLNAPNVGASGKFASSGSIITNASGIALSPIYTANIISGSYEVVASALGLSNQSFSLTNKPGVATTLTIQDGNNQSSIVATEFYKPLQIIAKDTYNNPVPGVTVTFSSPSSGAGGTFASTNVVATDINGVAVSPVFTANSISGNYVITASANGLTSQFITLTNLSGSLASLSLYAGNNQSTTVATEFNTSLQVLAKDSYGNPVPNITVTFTINGNGASGSFASSGEVTSNTSGHATAPKMTANTIAGNFTVTISATGASNVVLNLTNMAGAASAIVLTNGNNQNAIVNTPFAYALQTKVIDSYGNPVSGIPVTFSVPSLGATGSFAASNIVTTDTSGSAVAPIFTANTVTGVYQVSVTVMGLTSQSFSLCNNPGAASISIQDGDNQSAIVGLNFTVAMKVIAKDSFGNTVPGLSVTFTTPSTGASGTFLSSNTVITDISGIATSPAFKANTQSGFYKVVASGTGLNSQDFSLTNNAGVVTDFAILTGNNQSVKVGNAFATNFHVKASDIFGNGVPGVSVQFTAPSSGASGSFSGSNLTMTNSEGIASAPTFTTNAIAGSYKVLASATGLPTQNFSLTNNTSGATIAIFSGNNQSSTVGTSYEKELQVKFSDSFGNPISGVSVNLNIGSIGASGSFSGSSIITSDDSGIATAPAFTANGKSGNFTVTASAINVGSVKFSLTNTSGAASSITLLSGNNQKTLVNTFFGSPLVVLVSDSYGNPVGGEPVTFSGPGSGSLAVFGGSTIVSSNADGIVASPTISANTVAGTYTVTASASNVTSAQFTLTNAAGLPTSIVKTGGNNQAIAVNTAFTSPLSVKVSDSYGNPVSNLNIAFSGPSTGSSLAFSGASTVATNALGVATTPAISANSNAGTYSVQAYLNDSVTANFTLTNLAGVASKLVLMAGTNQSTTVNTAFSTSLQVQVTDAFGNPVSNAPVTFTGPASGAGITLTGNQNASSNSSGLASWSAFTANQVAGNYVVVASIAGGSNLNFALSNKAGAAAIATVTTGANQSTLVNTGFGSSLQVKVTDTFGNPLSNVPVTFAAPSSGASASFSGSTSVNTNTDGLVSSPTLTANTVAGNYVVTANVGSLGQSTFSMTNLAGAASNIIKTSGNNQSTVVNTAFSNPLQLKVTDAYGNPVANVPVSFTAPNSGSSLALGSTTPVSTNAQGIVSSPAITANTVAGNFAVNVTANGNINDSFSLTNLAGAASAIIKTSGNNQSTVVNTAFSNPLQLKVTDAYGNPVANVPVSFTAPNTGSSLTLASTSSVSTNTQGIVSSPAITANTVAGNFAVNVTANGNIIDSFTFTNLAGAASTIIKTSGNNQSTVVNTAFSNPLQLKVTDAYGNPVANVPVSFNVPSSGASLVLGSTTSVSTNTQGIANSPAITANTIAGGYSVNVTANGNITDSFTFTNLAGAAAKFIITAGDKQSTTVNTSFASGLKVLVTDTLNNPVTNTPVTFTVPSSGASVVLAGSNVVNTNSTGIVILDGLTANKIAGSFTVLASVPNLQTLNFNLTNNPGAVSSLVHVNGNNQSAVINGPFPSALQVKVVDAFGNAVANVPVSFTSPTTGATVSFVGGSNANSDNSGVATSSPIVANGLIGKYTVTASASGAPSVAFALTNTAPTLQSIVIQQGSTGRSFVRYVDININDPATVTSIVNSLNTSAPRITLTNTGLTGKTKKAVTIKGLAKAIGNTVRIDFGTKGIGGNAATTTADGSYLISLDVDGNGSLETSQRFFRLLGDVNGDKVVDAKDTALVAANLNKGGTNQPGDTNGDGKVNATDVSYVKKAQKRSITV